MKRFLFVYRTDREALCDPDYGHWNRMELEEREFPAGVTDEEVVKAARRLELKDRHEGRKTASEGIFNRRLLRIIQIAREVAI
jgi:hypothetical protein